MDRQAQKQQFEERLMHLHARGMKGTLARVFGEYIAAFSEVDRRFDALYVEGLFKTGTHPRPLRRRDRFRQLLRELEPALALSGCVAECGCASGLSSFLICSRLRECDPRFDGTGYEIYDSFEGLSAPRPEDTLPPEADPLVAASLRAGAFAFSLERVRASLDAFPRITYSPGWIPEAFPSEGRSYRFAHVDVDLYQPTKASLEYFWPRLVPGGIMVCDDYNWSGARRAVEEFAAAAGTRFGVTPHTQAVFTKA